MSCGIICRREVDGTPWPPMRTHKREPTHFHYFLSVKIRDGSDVPGYEETFAAAFMWAFLLWIMGLTAFALVRLGMWVL